MSSNMLNLEEQQHKDEIVSLTEQVLDANGIECDSKMSKISKEQLREILKQVRKLRKKRRLKKIMKDKYKKKKIFLYKNIKMSRNSPSASPLWPLIYGLGIVAFRFCFWRQVGRKTLYSIGMVIMNKRKFSIQDNNNKNDDGTDIAKG